MTAKEDLRQLVERLPEDEARLWLDAFQTRDPVLIGLLTAPYDDEPVTPEEEAAVQEAREELARGEGIPWEQVRLRGAARS